MAEVRVLLKSADIRGLGNDNFASNLLQERSVTPTTKVKEKSPKMVNVTLAKKKVAAQLRDPATVYRKTVKPCCYGCPQFALPGKLNQT